ncbi:hypothetical protein MTO96_003970 [Rhipicephalus appendiculatus]
MGPVEEGVGTLSVPCAVRTLPSAAHSVSASCGYLRISMTTMSGRTSRKWRRRRSLRIRRTAATAALTVLVVLSCAPGVSSMHSRGTSKRLIVREGHQTELPCDLRDALSNDSLAFVHWYHTAEREPHSSGGAGSSLGYGFRAAAASREPIYTVDFGPDPTVSREATSSGTMGGGTMASGATSSTGGTREQLVTAGHGWVGRAYFSIIGHPASLKVNSVRFEDAGLYTCTAVFRDGARRNSTVRLHVVAPPEPPVIRDGEGNELRGTIGPFNEGSTLALVCVVYGGKPKPTLVWSGMPDGMMAEVRPSSEAQLTTSTLLIHSLRREDLRATLYCTASNNISSPADTSVTLDLNHKPRISLQLGTKLSLENIQENNDVYLECRADANPPVDEVAWQFDGDELQASENVIVSKNFLVIQRVQTYHSGLYSCSAENSEGRTQGETLQLRVQHAPLCKANQHVVYAASRHQEVEVHCEVEADPSNVTFEWRFNSTLQQRPLKSFSAQGTSSVARYIPHSHTEYGTLLCTASNRIGKQRQPCLFPRRSSRSMIYFLVWSTFLWFPPSTSEAEVQNSQSYPPIMPLVGKLTKSGSAAKIYSSALLVTVIAAVALLCILPLIVLGAVKLKGRRFFNKSPEAKKDATDEDACPSTTAATPQEATQLQISSIYPKEDNQVWIVKKSTGL